VIKAPVEICPICEGTGWKNISTNARERRVTRCDCQLRARAQSLLAAARIPKRYEDCVLANYKFEGPYLPLAPARMAACRFVEEYPLDQTGLMFVGGSGLGKTHLAVGIMKALIREKGVESVFYDYAELLKEIQESYNPSIDLTELGLLRPVFRTEVLVLDDLGSVKPTEWRSDTIRLILNARYNNKLTTIITSNFADRPAAGAEEPGTQKSSESFAAAKAAGRDDTLGDRIGERMRSRLHEMCRLIEMNGEDYRYAACNDSVISVACADCPKCGKENVYKRVGAFRNTMNSRLGVPITCKRCGELFHVSKNQLRIRNRPTREINAEYSISSLEWM
jgi:DNA replication protein DnaC